MIRVTDPGVPPPPPRVGRRWCNPTNVPMGFTHQRTGEGGTSPGGWGDGGEGRRRIGTGGGGRRTRGRRRPSVEESVEHSNAQGLPGSTPTSSRPPALCSRPGARRRCGRGRGDWPSPLLHMITPPSLNARAKTCDAICIGRISWWCPSVPSKRTLQGTTAPFLPPIASIPSRPDHMRRIPGSGLLLPPEPIGPYPRRFLWCGNHGGPRSASAKERGREREASAFS